MLADFNPILPSSYQNCEYVLLGNLSPDIQRKIIQRLHLPPKLIIMDTMNFWIKNTYQELIETIRMVHILSIDDEEVRQLTKEYSLLKAAKKIMHIGPHTVIIKKGENGALLFSNLASREKKKLAIFSIPALVLEEVLDPTGAGDAFIGGLAGYISQKQFVTLEDIKQGAIYGSILASFCVEAFGIEGLINISKDTLLKRENQFSELRV